MADKVRVMVFIDWFYPAFKAGGPVKSVYNIVSALQNENEFFLVTSNRDVDNSLIEVESDKVIEKDGYSIIYLSKEKQSRKRYKELFDAFKPVVVYYNSLFSWKYTLLPYLVYRSYKIKQIIAPRGMLGKGALSLKPLKKKLFISLSGQFLFSKYTYWHASTDLEKEEIISAFPKAKHICIAQNISQLPTKRKLEKEFKRENELSLVFFSRISEKKNLHFLLQLLKEEKELDVRLDIFGPLEEGGYWTKCLQLIEGDRRINYKGVIKPADIEKALQDYHFSIHPTLHENFGHTIAESINAGVPIIISENTPWKEVEKSKVGFVIPLGDKLAWKKCLIHLSMIKQDTYTEMVSSCYDYSERNIVSSTVIEQNKKLFAIE